MSAVVRIALAGIVAGAVGIAARNRKVFEGVIEDGKIDVRRLRANVEQAGNDIDGKVDQMFSDAVSRINDGVEEIEKFLKNGFASAKSTDAAADTTAEATPEAGAAAAEADAGASATVAPTTAAADTGNGNGRTPPKGRAKPAASKPAAAAGAAKTSRASKADKASGDAVATAGTTKAPRAKKAPKAAAPEAVSDADATAAAIREAAAGTEAVDVVTGKSPTASRRKSATTAANSPARQTPVRRRSAAKGTNAQENGNAGV